MNPVLSVNEYIGLVCSAGVWRCFTGMLAEWILDYRAYDPSYDPTKWPDTPRNQLLQVGVDQAVEFQLIFEERELTKQGIQYILSTVGAPRAYPIAAVDFDTRRYVNGFYDLALEEYVPAGWISVFDDPLQYVSEDLRILWKNYMQWRTDNE
jgi:hypothetical protein